MSIRVGRLESLRRFRSAVSNRCVDSGRPTRIAVSIQAGRPDATKDSQRPPRTERPTEHLALARPLRPSLPTAPAFLICSRVSVSGEINPHCLALAPESETVKHRDRTKEQPKQGHSVTVEGISGLLDDSPYFDMYLPEQKGLEKPVPFWTVKTTHVEEEANMELIWVAVSVGVSTGTIAELNSTPGGEELRSYINPESTVKVRLPLYINHRRLEFGDQLRFFKAAEKPDEKKRKEAELDNISDFAKERAEASKRNKTSRA